MSAVCRWKVDAMISWEARRDLMARCVQVGLHVHWDELSSSSDFIRILVDRMERAQGVKPVKALSYSVDEHDTANADGSSTGKVFCRMAGCRWYTYFGQDEDHMPALIEHCEGSHPGYSARVGW